MNTKLAPLLLFLFSITVSAQVQLEQIESNRLGENREIKVQLPRNYDTNTEKTYPVVVVLDGDYLFEPIAGMTNYYSYWEEMPEVIVVGINQAGTKEADTFYSDVTGLPAKTGVAFYDFVVLEMMPWLDKEYRTNNFRIVAGHDTTANYLNYFLMAEEALFQAYISLSPDLSPKMNSRLTSQLEKTEQKIFYYLATSTEDIKSLRNGAYTLNSQLKSIPNKNLKFYFDNFDGGSHYSLVGSAIPSALSNIFAVYNPISKEEYNEVILKLEGASSPYDYLVDKYASIKEIFGLDEQIRLNDFTAISSALKKKNDWDGLEKLGKLAKTQYPKTMLGYYYIAQVLEYSGKPKKAMKVYQSAYLLEEISFLTQELLLEKVKKIKKDFGY